jgi:hypothetical protein
MRAVEKRCPEALDPQLSPETRRAYFVERNAELLDEAGRQLKEALAKGEISGKILPTTYGILADQQQRLEGWNREGAEKQGFGDRLAEAMLKRSGGKLMVAIEPGKLVEAEVWREDEPPLDGTSSRRGLRACSAPTSRPAGVTRPDRVVSASSREDLARRG